MSRSFEFHPAARDELRHAVDFYENERAGLGAKFAAEVRAMIEFVLRQPKTGSPAEAGTRRKILPRFPYSVIYVDDESCLTVVAVMHHRRKPGYWLDRVRPSEL